MAEIELGNGLPDVRTCMETVESLKKAGFEVIDSRDLALDVSSSRSQSVVVLMMRF